MASFAIKSAVSPSATAESKKNYAFKVTKVTGTEKKKLFFSELREGRFPAAIRISGALTTGGINSIEHAEWGTKWSFGLQVYEQEDIDILSKWSEAEHLSKAFTLPPEIKEDEIVTAPLFKDDGVLYIKMPVSKDDKTFACTSNLKMTPKKPSVDLFREMPVDVFVNVQAYLSTDEQPKWGLSLKIKHVDFWTDPDARTPEEQAAAPEPTTTVPTPPQTPTNA